VLMVMMLVVVMAALTVLMVMMLVVVMAALTVLMVMMLVVVMAALTVLVVMMLVTVLVTAAILIVMMGLLFKSFYLGLKCRCSFHSIKKLSAGKLIPIRRNNNCGGVMFSYESDAFLYFILIYELSVAEDYARRVFNLVVKEFAKVLHVHLALLGINNCCKSIKDCALCISTLYSLDNVGELAYSGWFDKNSVGCKLIYNLGKSLGKVADKRAANATRVHFVDLYSRICKKSAVDTDLAEFVFNKNDFLALICLCEKLFYKCCFTRSEKSGKNINPCHYKPRNYNFILCR